MSAPAELAAPTSGVVTGMPQEAPRNITPEQELQLLKLILKLRELDTSPASSERLRRQVREALLDAADDDDAMFKCDELIRRATRQQQILDGSYDARRERKRRKHEERMAQRSRFVDAEAESGTESEEEEEADAVGGE